MCLIQHKIYHAIHQLKMQDPNSLETFMAVEICWQNKREFVQNLLRWTFILNLELTPTGNGGSDII